MFPSPTTGFRVLITLQTGGDRYVHVDKNEADGFRFLDAPSEVLPFSAALSLLQRCHRWSEAQAGRREPSTGDFEARVPYFKFSILAYDKDGDVVFGWIPFAAATPVLDRDLLRRHGELGLPIHEYGGSVSLPETPEWFKGYVASGGHVVGSFEEKEEEAYRAALQTAQNYRKKRKREE